MEALCATGGIAARPWLLRRACDGDFLNGYFAGKAATAAHLHEAMTAPDADDQVIDHTGRLLRIMAECGGMGMTWQDYPPIHLVLDVHAGPLGLTPDRRDHLLNRYLAILRRPEWSQAARAQYDPANDFHAWVAKTAAKRLRLPALTEPWTATPANEARTPGCIRGMSAQRTDRKGRS